MVVAALRRAAAALMVTTLVVSPNFTVVRAWWPGDCFCGSTVELYTYDDEYIPDTYHVNEEGFVEGGPWSQSQCHDICGNVAVTYSYEWWSSLGYPDLGEAYAKIYFDYGWMDEVGDIHWGGAIWYRPCE